MMELFIRNREKVQQHTQMHGTFFPNSYYYCCHAFLFTAHVSIQLIWIRCVSVCMCV